MPLLSQGTVDSLAGLGDALLFNQGQRLRNLLELGGTVNRCSSEYKSGQNIGMFAALALDPEEEALAGAGNLAEQLTLEEAQAGAGERIMQAQINDPNFPEDVWAKMQHVHETPDGDNIVVHYWLRLEDGFSTGFKFK